MIKDLSFQRNQGEILCLLGPNGAGKSTTINILRGVLEDDRGNVLYHERDIKTCRKEFQKYLEVVPQDNVYFFGSLYGLKKEECNDLHGSYGHQYIGCGIFGGDAKDSRKYYVSIKKQHLPAPEPEHPYKAEKVPPKAVSPWRKQEIQKKYIICS
ncbi:MAG: ATP-binding cassette domain-containing protein [Anaerostipes sp.]|nr:ATP-binding cassette domain-containing protein [Anaerostipes sp.]